MLVGMCWSWEEGAVNEDVDSRSMRNMLEVYLQPTTHHCEETNYVIQDIRTQEGGIQQ